MKPIILHTLFALTSIAASAAHLAFWESGIISLQPAFHWTVLLAGLAVLFILYVFLFQKFIYLASEKNSQIWFFFALAALFIVIALLRSQSAASPAFLLGEAGFGLCGFLFNPVYRLLQTYSYKRRRGY